MLAAKVAFLRRPGSYPELTARVTAIETHMSWLFLTDHHAYKLKKPFRRNGIDHRTLAMRRLGCRREVRLNRRLAADVYLNVVPLTVTSAGLTLGGDGRPVDWLVRMRRLPAGLTLDRALAAGQIGPVEARRIVARLAPFFASASRARLSPAAYRGKLLAAITSSAAQLTRRKYGLSAPMVDALALELRDFIDTYRKLLDARVRAGRVVEGHGDLRPEHIYLTQPPTIIDCIEFDRNLRLRDSAEELAFLAMECDRAGRVHLNAWLFNAYRDLTGDSPPRVLIDFYKAYNAFLRARIAIWHLDDPDTGSPRRWKSRANDYLAHVQQYLARTHETD